MNGRMWTTANDTTLHELAGRVPDWQIAEKTGHAEVTVRNRRRAAGLPIYRNRSHWTRRDWLLNDAAGLDFQIPLCRI